MFSTTTLDYIMSNLFSKDSPLNSRECQEVIEKLSKRVLYHYIGRQHQQVVFKRLNTQFKRVLRGNRETLSRKVSTTTMDFNMSFLHFFLKFCNETQNSHFSHFLYILQYKPRISLFYRTRKLSFFSQFPKILAKMNS